MFLISHCFLQVMVIKRNKLTSDFLIEFRLPFFFNLAVKFYFRLPSLKYGLLLAIGSPLFRALLTRLFQFVQSYIPVNYGIPRMCAID